MASRFGLFCCICPIRYTFLILTLLATVVFLISIHNEISKHKNKLNTRSKTKSKIPQTFTVPIVLQQTQLMKSIKRGRKECKNKPKRQNPSQKNSKKHTEIPLAWCSRSGVEQNSGCSSFSIALEKKTAIGSWESQKVKQPL